MGIKKMNVSMGNSVFFVASMSFIETKLILLYLDIENDP